jgi:hypothetical protein
MYYLYQNYPNPFNPITKIKFSISPSSSPLIRGARGVVYIKITIYDILGSEVAILVNEQLTSAVYEVEWNAADYPSGIYFYTLQTGDYSETKKMVLLK